MARAGDVGCAGPIAMPEHLLQDLIADADLPEEYLEDQPPLLDAAAHLVRAADQ
jgi:hypothetical protein